MGHSIDCLAALMMPHPRCTPHSTSRVNSRQVFVSSSLAQREGGVLAATDERAPLQSALQGLARRCKGSDALEYQKAGRLARRANRQALFDKIRELYNAGKTVSAIARVVGFGGKSVARWVRLLVLPARNSMMPKTQSTPVYHEAFLLHRWAEGMTNGRRLVRRNPTAWLRRLLQPFSEAPCAVEGRCYAAKS